MGISWVPVTNAKKRETARLVLVSPFPLFLFLFLTVCGLPETMKWHHPSILGDVKKGNIMNNTYSDEQRRCIGAGTLSQLWFHKLINDEVQEDLKDSDFSVFVDSDYIVVAVKGSCVSRIIPLPTWVGESGVATLGGALEAVYTAFWSAPFEEMEQKARKIFEEYQSLQECAYQRSCDLMQD